MLTTELRFMPSEFRIAPASKTQPVRITGYAAVFNSLSQDLGGFREKILPGAFADAIAPGKEILALMHHDTKLIVGRRSAGTLLLHEDSRGLAVTIFPGDTSAGRDAVEMVRRKDIKGMSFRFSEVKDTWATEAAQRIRTISYIRTLMEVTLTGIPAYDNTTAEVKFAASEAIERGAPRWRTSHSRRRLQLAEMTH